MALLVAPGVCRYSINGTLDGQPVVNILDLNISDITDGTRAEACEFACGDLINQWADHVVPLLSTEYSFESVSWVDLDSLDGSTGERTSTDAFDLPVSGEDTGAAMPGGVAVLARKIGSGGRRERDGRWYIGGITEGYTAAGAVNVLNPSIITQLNDVLESLRSGLEGAETDGVLGIGYTSSPQVVHTVDGIYSGKSRITAIVVDPRLATQRRRQR